MRTYQAVIPHNPDRDFSGIFLHHDSVTKMLARRWLENELKTHYPAIYREWKAAGRLVRRKKPLDA